MTDIDEQTGNRGTGFRGAARQRAIDSYDSARGSVAGVGRRASEGIDEAPLIALAGGLAAGALIAALLPRTQAETRALRPLGDRLSGTAKAAAAAARKAGNARLGELGLTREKGSDALRSIFDGVSDAARSSAKAAYGTVKKNG
jgi:hypothetical protein